MYTLVALCGVGVERVVANELRKLNLRLLDTAFGKVRFEADTTGCYRALMGLRAADRVLAETANFPAQDFDALFEGIRAVPWEHYIPSHNRVLVSKVRSNRSQLSALTSIQGVVHKAAAERLCTHYGVRRLPETGQAAELRIYIEKNQVSALLDLSGDPLFKRGYRSEGGVAPLRETTAAAILLLSSWRRKFPLYDPLCGSGTIITEAALYAWDAAPGLGRRFALGGLLIGDRKIEQRVRDELASQVNFQRTIRISGSDEDPRAVSIAISNLRRAYNLAQGVELQRGILPELRLPGLPQLQTLALKDARAFPLEDEHPGFIVTNPPYGKRLGDSAAAEAGYQNMSILGRTFKGWKLALITDHPGFESHFGRKADSCRELTNGAIESYFYQYEQL